MHTQVREQPDQMYDLSSTGIPLFSDELPPALGVHHVRIIYTLSAGAVPEYYDFDVEVCRSRGELMVSLTPAGGLVSLEVHLRREQFRCVTVQSHWVAVGSTWLLGKLCVSIL